VINLDKKILPIFFILLLLLGTGVASAADRSYSIPLMNQDLYLQEDGTLHVVETIHYSFSGTYNGVYRDIPVSGQQNLENIKVNAQGAYTSFQVINQGNTKRVKIYLYSDPGKTTPITDKDVQVTIEYDFVQVIKIYNDIAELQYKLVGESWEVPIQKVTANIHVNSSDGVKYWLNPPYYADNSAWQGNTLQVTSKSVPSGKYFEIRMVLPKNQFATNATNALFINENGLSQIENIQNNYQNQINFQNNLYTILAIIMLLICLIPVLIYIIFGREPKIDYKAEYERDIPTKDPPAMVNAISGPGFSKKVGEPDLDGYKATIMDLVDRKFLIMKAKEPKKEGYGVSGSIYFKISSEKDFSSLKEFELDVIEFLKKFRRGSLISLDAMSDDLSDRGTAKSFLNTFKNWKKDIKNELLSDSELKKIFDKKGDIYTKIFGFIGFIFAALVFFFTISNPLPAATLAFFSSIVLGIVSIISLVLPQKIAGHWTTYGEEYDAKWQNFRKYIKDFSLIKEYPPESIAIWNKYLVYATALGVAKEVRKAMEEFVPKDQLEGSDIYLFHYYGGYLLLSSSFDTGMATASSSSGAGGVGDVGGGAGGGGGGAF
jgi:uncharacterized membrane protein